MTNKSLSQQLCEACGIKPKYKCKNVPCLNFMADSGICILKDGFTKCNPEICEDDYTPDTNHRNWKEAEAVYPDFENNNNNFAKLLEIVSKKSSVSFCHNGTYYGCSIHYFFKDIFEAVEGTLQHNFLNTLLVQDLRNPCKPKLLEQIKQSIKNEQWEV